MSLLIRNATILAMDGAHGSAPFKGDILVERDRIAAIGDNVPAPDGTEVIDGTDKLVIPGLVNAHLHSWEAMFKGRYDNMPLELWMLYSYPILGCTPLDARLIYLRTMLVGMESLKNGVTCVVDDIIELPGQSMEALTRPSRPTTISACAPMCSGHIINKPFTDTIPYATEILPKHLLAARQQADAAGHQGLPRFQQRGAVAVSGQARPTAICDRAIRAAAVHR